MLSLSEESTKKDIFIDIYGHEHNTKNHLLVNKKISALSFIQIMSYFGLYV